jgi:hypothetical protein
LVGFVAGTVLLLVGASAATSASTNLAWESGSAAVLPANAATGKQQIVSLNSVSCASAGNCSAVGGYVDSSGNTQGLLMTETAGIWATGVEAALPADAAANPHVSLDLVSCASAGNCSAVGGYADSSGNSQLLLLTEADGVWEAGVAAALPANARAGGGGLGAVSCASAGNCSAVGFYTTRSKNMEPLLLSEKAGSWVTGVEAKLPANAATRKRSAPLNSVSCASPGKCSAVGGYFDKSGNSQALLLNEKAGRWSPGVEGKLPANTAATHKYSGETVLLLAVSCASAGRCSAVGSYCAVRGCNRIGKGSGSSGEQGLLLTEKAGRWRTGVEAKLPANAAKTGPLQYLNSISCASAGNCSAVGSYFDSSLKTHLVLLTEKAGHWAKGVKAALPTNAAAAQAELGVNSVSCSSAGNCTAAGTYSGSGQDNTHPLLLTETAGVWARGVAVALPANASAPSQYSWVTVSCAFAQDCSGAGFYADSSNGQQGLLLSNTTPSSLRRSASSRRSPDPARG